ncbi:MAG: alternative ribosome rescue aminoacyl-tRNA hydrolase ArfB, partial [Pseudomonadota bacterium]
HVNKVSTAVQLRFDAANSPSLTPDVRRRLIRLAGSRATKEGGIIISASRFASQKQNREDAVSRLVDLVARAAVKPKYRVKTRPSFSARRRRMDEKRQRSQKKGLRKTVSLD